MLPHRALSGGRSPSLGATRDFHLGLLRVNAKVNWNLMPVVSLKGHQIGWRRYLAGIAIWIVSGLFLFL